MITVNYGIAPFVDNEGKYGSYSILDSSSTLIGLSMKSPQLHIIPKIQQHSGALRNIS